MSNTIAYLENMDRRGAFGVPYIISNNVDRVHHAFPKDMDGESLAVKSQSCFAHKSFIFPLKHGLNREGDGDIDILVACDYVDMLYWYPNRLIDRQPPKVCDSFLLFSFFISQNNFFLLLPN